MGVIVCQTCGEEIAMTCECYEYFSKLQAHFVECITCAGKRAKIGMRNNNYRAVGREPVKDG